MGPGQEEEAIQGGYMYVGHPGDVPPHDTPGRPLGPMRLRRHHRRHFVFNVILVHPRNKVYVSGRHVAASRCAPMSELKMGRGGKSPECGYWLARTSPVHGSDTSVYSATETINAILPY